MPSFVPPIANSFVFVFGAEECDHRARAGTTNQSGGNFYAPTTKCGLPLFGYFCSGRTEQRRSTVECNEQLSVHSLFVPATPSFPISLLGGFH